VSDSGRFNYHLDRLEGRFVPRVENGYALRRSGRQLVRTVVAGTGIEEPTLEPTEIEADCPFRGAPLAVTYEDEWLYEICTECPGAYEGGGTVPDGYLAGAALAPAGPTDRTPAEAWAALTRAYQDTRTLVEGGLQRVLRTGRPDPRGPRGSRPRHRERRIRWWNRDRRRRLRDLRAAGRRDCGRRLSRPREPPRHAAPDPRRQPPRGRLLPPRARRRPPLRPGRRREHATTDGPRGQARTGG